MCIIIGRGSWRNYNVNIRFVMDITKIGNENATVMVIRHFRKYADRVSERRLDTYIIWKKVQRHQLAWVTRAAIGF
jgi:hypothetical protein